MASIQGIDLETVARPSMNTVPQVRSYSLRLSVESTPGHTVAEGNTGGHSRQAGFFRSGSSDHHDPWSLFYPTGTPSSGLR